MEPVVGPNLKKQRRIVWHWTRNGEYSVKYSYCSTLKLLEKVILSATSSSFCLYPSFWEKVRAFKCSLKVKHFMWRFHNNVLATGENLYSRNHSHPTTQPPHIPPSPNHAATKQLEPSTQQSRFSLCASAHHALQMFFGFEPYPGFHASMKARIEADIKYWQDNKSKKKNS
ncbi:hypothetical protein LguiA_002254 [Lonicera macranthoides]